MKLRQMLYMLMVLPLLWSCNNEDDIEEIFVSGTWHVADYYTKADWNKRNGTPKYISMYRNEETRTEGRKALETISGFNITFKADGTFAGQMQNASFEGTWQADGKERTLRLTMKGNPNTSTAYNKEFIETLNNVAFYQGDSNYLMLGPEDKRSYIQFGHQKQNID